MLDRSNGIERENAPAPEMGTPRAVGTAVPIDPGPRTPPMDGRSEWRGTLVEAIRESEQRSGATGFASADWASQPTLRVMTPRELSESVERVHAQIAPGVAQPKAYTVGPDGTIHNTVTNRPEYVPVRQGQEERREAEVTKQPLPNPPKTPSGASWVAQFPQSTHTSDLTPGFRRSVDGFIGAMIKAGAHVEVGTTLRPKERAYLMHYSWKVGKEGLDPESVPPMAGVNIDWVHRKADGSVDAAASRAAANEMNNGFGTVFQPALTSRHTEGKAIDMTISWTGNLVIQDASGQAVTIHTTPRNGQNAQLIQVGASYGVVKLKSDPPHWSEDGH